MATTDFVEEKKPHFAAVVAVVANADSKRATIVAVDIVWATIDIVDVDDNRSLLVQSPFAVVVDDEREETKSRSAASTIMSANSFVDTFVDSNKPVDVFVEDREFSLDVVVPRRRMRVERPRTKHQRFLLRRNER